MMVDDACANRSVIHFKQILFLDYGLIFFPTGIRWLQVHSFVITDVKKLVTSII